METKTDVSYGVIPFFKEDNEWRVFLINEISWTGNIFWTFPKGHPEAGELPTETAERELFEEAGIRLRLLFPGVAFDQAYSFKHEDYTIDKTVKYYFGIAENKEFATQEDEVKEAAWFSLEEALQKLTHDSTRLILKGMIPHLPH